MSRVVVDLEHQFNDLRWLLCRSYENNITFDVTAGGNTMLFFLLLSRVWIKSFILIRGISDSIESMLSTVQSTGLRSTWLNEVATVACRGNIDSVAYRPAESTTRILPNYRASGWTVHVQHGLLHRTLTSLQGPLCITALDGIMVLSCHP